MKRPAAHQRMAAWLPLLAWMALIYLVSDQPDIPQVGTSLLDLLVKKSLHALAYAILATLFWRALKTTPRLQAAALPLALLLTIFYAASDEWHQTFVPGRSGRLSDVLIDTLGAVAAILLLHRRSPNRR